jgi:DNA repair protein RecO (recombination protein O)
MRQPHLLSTEACILKRMDYGEADRILTLFTPNQGKLRAIAKGARRTTSRLAGHVEPFTRSQLQLASGRELAIVTQGEVREPFPHLRDTLWHATTAYYLAELLDKFTEDHSEHRELYTLLIDTLRRLDEDAAHSAAPQSPAASNGHARLRESRAPYAALNGDVGASVPGNGAHNGADNGAHHAVSHTTHTALQNGAPNGAAPYRSRAWQIVRYFELHLLGALGYQPALHECAACSTPLQPVENGFNATLGGVLCPNCSRYAHRPVSLSGLKVLRLFQTTPWERLPRLRLELSQQQEIESLLHALIRFHLEREVKSWEFLRHIQPAE